MRDTIHILGRHKNTYRIYIVKDDESKDVYGDIDKDGLRKLMETSNLFNCMEFYYNRSLDYTKEFNSNKYRCVEILYDGPMKYIIKAVSLNGKVVKVTLDDYISNPSIYIHNLNINKEYGIFPNFTVNGDGYEITVDGTVIGESSSIFRPTSKAIQEQKMFKLKLGMIQCTDTKLNRLVEEIEGTNYDLKYNCELFIALNRESHTNTLKLDKSKLLNLERVNSIENNIGNFNIALINLLSNVAIRSNNNLYEHELKSKYRSRKLYENDNISIRLNMGLSTKNRVLITVAYRDIIILEFEVHYQSTRQPEPGSMYSLLDHMGHNFLNYNTTGIFNIMKKHYIKLSGSMGVSVSYDGVIIHPYCASDFYNAFISEAAKLIEIQLDEKDDCGCDIEVYFYSLKTGQLAVFRAIDNEFHDKIKYIKLHKLFEYDEWTQNKEIVSLLTGDFNNLDKYEQV